jgi:uncharacterized protein (TIGR02145 family)
MPTGIGIGISPVIQQGAALPPIEYRNYLARVAADSGIVESNSDTLKVLKGLKTIYGTLANHKLIWTGEMGYKERVSGINHYATKAYSADAVPNDLTQATELSQPFLSGNIAPNEKQCLQNPNGGVGYMTHTPISFGANDTWSASFVTNFKGALSGGVIIGDSVNERSRIGFIVSSIVGNKFIFVTNDSNITGSGLVDTSKHNGNNIIISFVANGNGTLSIYKNGVFSETINIATNFIFRDVFKARSTNQYYGKLYSYTIKAGASTPTQVAQEYALLRGIYPEVESVVIGSQTWTTSNCDMVATPQGNIIPNMVANTGVEKVVNGGFDSGASWNSSRFTIANGLLNINVTAWAGPDLIQYSILSAKRRYRVSFDVVNYISAEAALLFFPLDGTNATIDISGNGSYVGYITCNTSGNLYINTANGNYSIDNVSVLELGWSNSTEIYDAVYASTTGTAAQKEYAALKEAAMWCYYNNDSTLGATYGKLYNWYAVKLLQLDIDLYNTANPTKLWGWRVPTSADFTTLQTALGGASVAGGKMKVAGLSYWNTPNTGADNSSGFSAVAGGFRDSLNGLFSSLNDGLFIYTLDLYRVIPTINSSELFMYNSPTLKSGGYSQRLIKA